MHQIHSLDGWKWSIENPANLTEGGHQTPPEHQANFLYVDVITNFKSQIIQIQNNISLIILQQANFLYL